LHRLHLRRRAAPHPLRDGSPGAGAARHAEDPRLQGGRVMSGIAKVRAHLAKIPPANTVAEKRAQYDRAERVFPVPSDVGVKTVTIKPTQGPEIAGEWLEPPPPPEHPPLPSLPSAPPL